MYLYEDISYQIDLFSWHSVIPGCARMILGHWQRCDGEMMMGKKGAGGVSIFKSTQGYVLGTYEEGVQPGENSNEVGKIADYLKSINYWWLKMSTKETPP